MTASRHVRAAFWQRAASIRDEWEAYGTACGPADQTAAEQAIGRVYAQLGRPVPEFAWVRSPREAQPLVGHLPTLDDLFKGASPFLASDLATHVSGLRGRLDSRIDRPWFDPPPPKRRKGEPWPDLPVGDGLDYGIPFLDIVRRHVRESLFSSLAHGFYLLGKRLLGDPNPVCWYGQQEAHWIAYYDVWRRLGLAKYDPRDEAGLETWQTIARNAGWFWPDERLCVVSQRPIAPMTFADGWSLAA